MMVLRYKYFFLVLCSFLALATVAQDTISTVDTSSVTEKTILSRANNLFNARISFGVPNPTGNKAFRKSFVGIYQINGSFNLSLNVWFFIGVSFSNAVLQVNRNIIPNTYIGMNVSHLGASMNIYNAAIKLGGNFYIGENNRTLFSADISAGQTYVKYQAFICKDPAKALKNTDFKSLYMETGISMLFLIEENWGIGPAIIYGIIARSFNPYDICLDDWASYNKNNPGAIQYLSFGFVGHYSFFKK